MKIEKILIKNFKNIKDTLVISFKKDVTLFVGPNGFGKTTIFDAIELSLTGKIRRISEADYSDGRNNFETPYFQNNPKENTLIKLMLTNDKGESLSIVSLYDNTKNSKVSNVPKLSFSKFKRGIQFNIKDAFENINNLSVLQFLEEKDVQKKIGVFLGYKSEDYSIGTTFNLFNYVQQDEVDYYLKQKEKDRKECLNFLLNIDAYSDRKNNLEKLKRVFSDSKKELQARKNKLKLSSIRNSVIYEKLPLRADKEFLFNNKDIVFDDELSEESLNSYLRETEKLRNFKETFSPKDYFRRKQSEEFDKEILNNKDFINYLLFKEILDDIQSVKKVHSNYQLLSDEKNYSFYLLKNYITRIDSLENDRKMFELGERLKDLLSVESNKMKIESIRETIYHLRNWEYGKVWFKEFEETYIEYSKNLAQLDENSGVVNKILELRSILKSHRSDNHSKCVYCGYDWLEKEKLLDGYEKMTEVLRSNLSAFETVVEKLSLKLTKMKADMLKQIKNEYEKLTIIPIDILKEIHSLVNYKISVDFEKLVKENTDIKPILLNSEVTLQQYKNKKNDLIIFMQKQFLIPKETYRDFVRIEKQKTDLDKLREKYSMISAELILKYHILLEAPISLNLFQHKKEELLSFLEKIKLKITFDWVKSSDPQKIFENYFDSNEELFGACSLECIDQKHKYIIYQFEFKKQNLVQQLDERMMLIYKADKYLKDRINELKENIKEYQEQMIQKLKLPFYMYTAKILQNYHQGMGVLLTTQNNSNIRFVANSNSNQDVMYQLSSGQIAVISFAFALALNTTFRIAKGGKLLAIDDPFQDMDSMNVYALIDLIRHSLPDYQIIMSTHSDSSAMFIKYKFELFSDTSKYKVSLKNIKNILLERDNSKI